jgi:hypothetical protein
MYDYRIRTAAELAKFINDWAKIMYGDDLGMTETDVERLDDERAIFTVRLPGGTSSSARLDLARSVIDGAAASIITALSAATGEDG